MKRLLVSYGSDAENIELAEKLQQNEKTEQMARQRHLLYTAEYEVKENGRAANTVVNDDSIKKSARDKWYLYKQFQRESNIYACLSIRLKLQLCGYDYSIDGEDCSDEFITRYEQRDKRTPSAYTLDNKPIWQYSNEEQFRESIRWTLAVQEHLPLVRQHDNKRINSLQQERTCFK